MLQWVGDLSNKLFVVWWLIIKLRGTLSSRMFYRSIELHYSRHIKRIGYVFHCHILNNLYVFFFKCDSYNAFMFKYYFISLYTCMYTSLLASVSVSKIDFLPSSSSLFDPVVNKLIAWSLIGCFSRINLWYSLKWFIVQLVNEERKYDVSQFNWRLSYYSTNV